VQENRTIDKMGIGNLICDPETYYDGGPTYDEGMPRLRRVAPLCWVTPDHYRPFWLVTEHADIRAEISCNLTSRTIALYAPSQCS
jgi:hypothetical protein